MNDLRELRRMAGLTQFELAQRCAVSRMRLSLAECGQLELRIDEVINVRKVLLEHIKNQATRMSGVLSGTEAQPAVLAT